MNKKHAYPKQNHILKHLSSTLDDMLQERKKTEGDENLASIYTDRYVYLDTDKIVSTLSGDSKMLLEEISDILHEQEGVGRDISNGLEEIWELITYILEKSKKNT